MTKFAMKNNWNYIRKLAGLPKLRIYDLRHTAITRLAEKGVPIAMIMAFAGHISAKMSQHYTTVSMQALRAMARQAAHENQT
jgi:integrase